MARKTSAKRPNKILRAPWLKDAPPQALRADAAARKRLGLSVGVTEADVTDYKRQLERLIAEKRETIQMAFPDFEHSEIERLATSEAEAALFLRGIAEQAVSMNNAKSTKLARDERHARFKERRDNALRLAADMKRRNPSLSNREIARKLEGEIGEKESTIRDWMSSRKK